MNIELTTTEKDAILALIKKATKNREQFACGRELHILLEVESKLTTTKRG